MIQKTMNAAQAIAVSELRKIKCVVWDLDNTLWIGTLLENEQVRLNESAAAVVKVLDSRGILNSIASKNDHDRAMNQLKRFGLAEYFLYPQIGWNPKSASIKRIAQEINIGSDTLALVDDQPFELEEVRFALPEVLCIDVKSLGLIPNLPEMNPVFVTEDSGLRRKLYLYDQQRRRAEKSFQGTSEEFLATLRMRLRISLAVEDDLRRAEELTARTHQLNSTGYTYTYDELKRFSESKGHLLLIAELNDTFGEYGTIGLALAETSSNLWTIKLLLMSCRVVSRGIGTIMLSHIMQEANRRGVKLRAEFVHNGRNRMMYVTYKFAGFRTISENGSAQLLETDLQHIQEFPNYIEVITR